MCCGRSGGGRSRGRSRRVKGKKRLTKSLTVPANKEVGMNFSIRALESKDLKNGFKETLYNLCDEEIEHLNAIEHYESIKEKNDHFVYVATDDSKVVGTGCLVLDRKFINNCGLVGRIEDLSTRKGYENKGVAKSIMSKLVEIAHTKGCYKVTAGCSKSLKFFFEDLGFSENGGEMKLLVSKSTNNNC